MHDKQDESRFEVSLSYLCPSHLWHYCVQLVRPLCVTGEGKMVKLMLSQAENNMAETEAEERFCSVQAKLKGKHGDA